MNLIKWFLFFFKKKCTISEGERGERYDEDNWDKNRERNPDRDRYGFKDDDEEYTSVERTHTTKTEKITTNRRTRSIGKKFDLGAASSYGKNGETQVYC